MSVSERFDVIVVGARCAGSPLATFLQRAGLSVCVVDQAEFPSDTLSTHMFQLSGIEILQKLGALDGILAEGAPPITDCYMKFEDVDLSGPPRLRPHDPKVPMLCVRRIALDVHLVAAARAAGVEMRLHRRVVGLIEDDGRVVGVRTVDREGKVATLRADLVVGADGRLSTIARLTGARRYHVTTSERMSSWAYYRGVPKQPVAKVYYHRKGDDFVVAAPADNGHFVAIVCPSLDEREAYRVDGEGAYWRTIEGCAPVAELVRGAERVTKFRGLTRFEGFFREATGRGWVLAGDAGHFKDPTPGQGISDALRQVEKLSEAIVRGFSRPDRRDEELRRWWRWRDADAMQHYWFAADIGKRGPISPVLLEILRGVAANEELRQDFLDIFLHRAYPREVFGFGALAMATARMLADPHKRRGALGEAAKLVAEELGRRKQALRPRLTEKAIVDEMQFDQQTTSAA
ncbi:MAG: FAD-dependent monooxygenase [Acidobacteria bacterium]|nr:FAD-dependent monooxygenase [Acidobacteriota bacterium]